MFEAVEHKLKAYTWNLVERYKGNLVFRLTEIDKPGCLTYGSAERRFGGGGCDYVIAPRRLDRGQRS
jgi:hypothetical protein